MRKFTVLVVDEALIDFRGCFQFETIHVRKANQMRDKGTWKG
jgi:hypothetical protein